MNMNLERSEDRGAAHPHDDAAPDPPGGAGGRHDPRAPGLRRDHVAEDDRRRCRRVRGDGRQDRQEARLRRLQGFPHRRSSTTTACRRAELHQELSPDDTGAEIVAEGLPHLDPCAGGNAVDPRPGGLRAGGRPDLHDARQRDFYGIGGSAQIARDVAHKFLRIGVRTSVFDDAHMMLMSASLLGAGRRRDRLLAFGHDHRRHRAPGAGPPARRPHHRPHQLRRLAAGRDRRRRAVLDRARIAAARRERRRPHRPAHHLRCGLRRRRAARPRGGRTQPRRDHGCRARQTKRRMHMTSPDSPRRRRRRQPPLRHHGRCAGPAAQGRDGDRLRLAPEVRRQGRQPGRRGGQGRRRAAMAGAVGDDEFGRSFSTNLDRRRRRPKLRADRTPAPAPA